VKFPLGTKTTIMSDTQVYAAALTFANRRALQNAYGLVIAGEDTDGATGRQKPSGPSAVKPPRNDLKELAIELWRLTEPFIPSAVRHVKTWDARNQWLWSQEILDGAVPDTAPELSREKFLAAIAAVKAKGKP
jgi:hypothetical protein